MTNPNPVTLVVINKRGLHARASAALARLAKNYKATIRVSKNGEAVTATSIMSLLMLGAAKGDSLDLSADGEDAEAALLAVCTLVKDGFGELEAD